MERMRGKGKSKTTQRCRALRDSSVADRNTRVKPGMSGNREDFVMSQDASKTGWDCLLRSSSYFDQHGPSWVGFMHEEEQKREKNCYSVIN